MARPRKEGLDYFPHDTDAASDEKIEALTIIYGAKGYAFYFILLERIYRQPNFELDVSDAETREEIKQILCRKMSVTIEEFDRMLKTAFKHGCIDKEEYEKRGVLTSVGIKKRASVVAEKRDRMREKYSKEKIVSDAETREETREETVAETPQSKVKESKVKENKKSVFDFSFYTENEELLEALQGFYAMRKAIKKPMTDNAVKLMCKKLDKLSTYDDEKISILNKSTMSSWTDIYALSDMDYSNGKNGWKDKLENLGG